MFRISIWSQNPNRHHLWGKSNYCINSFWVTGFRERDQSNGLVEQIGLLDQIGTKKIEKNMNDSRPNNNELREVDPYTEFIRLLSEDPQVGEERYLELRSKLVRLFRVKRLSDAETLADETLHRAAISCHKNNLDLQNVQAWCFGIASRIAQEKYREIRRHEPDYDFSREEDKSEPDQPAEDERLDCLRECLSRLAPADRQMVIDYYNDEIKASENRRRMAEQLKLKENTLRKQTARLRDKLRDCTQRCLTTKGKL